MVTSVLLNCFHKGSISHLQVEHQLLLGTREQLQSPVLQPCPCSPPSVGFSVGWGTGEADHLSLTLHTPWSPTPAFPHGAELVFSSRLFGASGHVISIARFSAGAWASLGSCDAAVVPSDKATFGFWCCACFSQTLCLCQCCLQLRASASLPHVTESQNGGGWKGRL